MLVLSPLPGPGVPVNRLNRPHTRPTPVGRRLVDEAYAQPPIEPQRRR
jgi:hypothetical protein